MPDEDATGARGECTRRTLVRAAGTFGVAVPLSLAGVPASAVAGPPGDGLTELGVRPRADWAGARIATGPLSVEAAGDVRFLTIHHTASSNSYLEQDVPRLIRGVFAAHTSEKGWPDVAYNFFVDRYGGIWEGRTGSIAGPVVPDATGGYQGFSQLCCLIGDHRSERPTDVALDSLNRLLAVLAARYGIDPRPDAVTTFTSRGSNRWPRGQVVTTRTIAGHRDVSRTVCPGDACYSLIGHEIAVRAAAPEPAGPQPTRAAPPFTEPVPPDRAADRALGMPAGSAVGLGVAAAAAVGGVVVAAVRGRAGGRRRESPGPQ